MMSELMSSEPSSSTVLALTRKTNRYPPNEVYKELLEYLAQLRSERNVWIALPGEVNDWWRDRRRMTLVRSGSTWCIEGPGSDRARIAYASLHGDSVTYRVAESSI